MAVTLSLHAVRRIRERTSLEPSVVRDILNTDRFVLVSSHETNAHYRLFYSKPDNECFIAVVSNDIQLVITVFFADSSKREIPVGCKSVAQRKMTKITKKLNIKEASRKRKQRKQKQYEKGKLRARQKGEELDKKAVREDLLRIQETDPDLTLLSIALYTDLEGEAREHWLGYYPLSSLTNKDYNQDQGLLRFISQKIARKLEGQQVQYKVFIKVRGGEDHYQIDL